MSTSTTWAQWEPPYDPRMADSAIAELDEHGRLIEKADCGVRCPGCGICCLGYRDSITADYAGVEEYEANLKLGRGGLIRMEIGSWYRAPYCGEACPGFALCCPPFDQRRRPVDADDARRVLLEQEHSQRWEMQEALLILTHDGSYEALEALEAFMPRCHSRLKGFAGCALDEGRYFASLPGSREEARGIMKREVLEAWTDRSIELQGEIWEDLEPAVERSRYELEIVQRLLAKATDEADREHWKAQVDVYHTMAQSAESRLAEHEQQMACYDTMAAEVEADLLEYDPLFLARIARARGSLQAGLGIRLEDLPDSLWEEKPGSG